MSREVRDKLLEGAMDVLGNLETYEESVAFVPTFSKYAVSSKDPYTVCRAGGNADELIQKLDLWNGNGLLGYHATESDPSGAKEENNTKESMKIKRKSDTAAANAYRKLKLKFF
jgi:hypothetical protein